MVEMTVFVTVGVRVIVVVGVGICRQLQALEISAVGNFKPLGVGHTLPIPR